MNIPIVLLPDGSGGFTAICDMFSVVSEGDSKEDAIENIKEAIECHVEGVKKEKLRTESKYTFVVSLDKKEEKYKNIHSTVLF